jgi:hypothetical protein
MDKCYKGSTQFHSSKEIIIMSLVQF